MPKPKTDGGYILPNPIDGERICVTVNVPNVPEHRQAFAGALLTLTRWYTWQRDDAHTAAQVARIWEIIVRNVLAQLDSGGSDCGETIMDVRQNAENPCILEKSLNGVTWEPFANLLLCSPDSIIERYDPDTGEKEVSYDGGETWENGQAHDPRYNSPLFAPITGTCAESNSIVRMVQEIIIQTVDDINLGLAAAYVLSAILGLVVTVLTAGAAAPLALALITTITALGTAAVNAALTNAVWEDFRCIVYETIGGATTITPAHFETIKSRIPEIGDAIAEAAIYAAFVQLGPAGMHNAATLGMAANGISPTCDCPFCEGVIDFVPSQGGTTLENGEYVQGLGYRSLVVADQWGTHKRIGFFVDCPEGLSGGFIDVHVASGYNSGGNGSLFARFFANGVQVSQSGGYFIAQGTTPLTATFGIPVGLGIDRVLIYQWAVHSQVSEHTVIDWIEFR